MKRRTFLKSGAAFLAASKLGLVQRALAAPLPGGTLDPTTIPKYQRELVILPAMPSAGLNYYEIAVRQFQQQVLPFGLPKTTVWSYGAVNIPATCSFCSWWPQAHSLEGPGMPHGT